MDPLVGGGSDSLEAVTKSLAVSVPIHQIEQQLRIGQPLLP